MCVRVCLVEILIFFFSYGFVFAQGNGLDIVGNLPLFPSPDTVGVQALGMGNAGSAIAEGTSGLFLNPAGLGYHPGQYIMEASFSFHPDAESRILNVSVIDSKSNQLLGAGLSYSYVTSPREDDGKVDSLNGHVARLNTAMSLKKTISLGMSLKYLYLTRPFKTKLSSFNLDFGLIWKLHQWAALSIVGYNVLTNEDPEIPLSMAVGFALGGKTPFQLVLDWIVDFQSKKEIGHELRAGLQFRFLKTISVRLGYQLDQIRDRWTSIPSFIEASTLFGHYLSAGLGLRYQKIGAQVAFRQQVSRRYITNRYIGFSLQLWL